MKARNTITFLAALLGLFISVNAVFGQLDSNFRPPYVAYPDFLKGVLLPDGKYVTFFNLETLADQPAGPITRYFADGTLDTSFSFSRQFDGVTAVAGLADGRLIVAASQHTYGSGYNDQNHQIEQILLLNTDGSIDPAFAANAPQSTDGAEVRAIRIQPDGKILVCGRFTAFNGTARQGIVRLNPNGTLDPNFAATTLTATHPFAFPPGIWADPAIQTDVNGLISGIFISGDFDTVNGVNRPGIARLHANDGTLDTSFQPSGFTPTMTGPMRTRPIRGVVIQSNGQIVIGGRFTVPATFLPANTTGMTYTKLPLVRLNSDGSADPNFGYVGSMDTADATFTFLRALVIQPDDKVIGVDTSVYRFNSNNGQLDQTFRQPDLLINQLSANNLPSTFPSIPESFLIYLRTDGRILISGIFSDVDDASPLPANGERWGVAQFNSDGTLDTTFKTSRRQAQSAYPTSFLRQADGTTLIGFNQVGLYSGHHASGVKHNYGRLFLDGSFDASFDPLASLPNGSITGRGFTLLPSGNILGFGYNDQTGNFSYGILKPDGTVADPNYTNDPNLAGFDKAYPQPLPTPGEVLVVNSSAQTDFNGFQRSVQSVVSKTQVQRLNSNGSLDTTFSLDESIRTNTVQRQSGTLQAVAADSRVLAVFNDGKILFSYLATDSSYRLVRLNPNGSLDASFQAGSVQANTTSSPQFIFDPVANTNVTVPVITSSGGVPGFSDAQIVTGNQIIVAGQFTTYANNIDNLANSIMRLNGDGTVDTTFNIGKGPQWIQTTGTTILHPSVDNVELAKNGKLLITGTFEAFDSVPYPGIALLNANGSLDTSFSAPAIRQKFDYHTAYLAIQPDSSFLLSGPYSFSNGTQSPSFIHIFGTPAITSPTTATATVGQLFVYQVTATNGPINYSASPLPPGMTFDPERGILGGTPTTAGTTQIQVTASNSFGTGVSTLTLTVQPAPSSGPVVTSGTSITARTGVPFSYEVFTTGGSPTARLSVSGLPPGLSADTATGRISGTPTSDGSFGLTLTVTDGPNITTSTLQLTFTSDFTIPVIVSSRETSITTGQFFTYTIVAPGSDPTNPATFTLVGTLPHGLGLDPVTGIISGTFNVHAQNGGALLGNVQVVATNSSGTTTSPLSFFQSVPATAVNISTRLAVGTSDNVLIGGFIVTGNAPKKVIVRAVGPELTALGVPGAMQDTTLELHDGTGALIGTNDDWKTTVIGGAITEDQADAIHTSGAGPTDDRESAIIATLAPYDPSAGGPVGVYTAIVRGKDGTTGVASVELYDLGTASLDISSKAQLANISTRGVVQTGDNVMIGGFIIQGDSPAKVIVRAIGPSLTAKGVAGALADPTLELHDGTGTLIATNDDWRTTQIGGVIVADQSADIQASGLAPTDDHESAILATLPPGNYTGIVRGKNNTTGVALVEAYGLQ